MHRRIAALALVVLAAAVPGPAVADFLGEPGSGTHIIPDPRPPRGSPPPAPPAPRPPNFMALLTDYERHAQNVAALVAWFQTLSPAEQERFRPQYNAALDALDASATAVADRVNGQLERGEDGNLYYLLNLIRIVDPVRARAIWLSVLEKVAARVNADYLADPTNPAKARRARDVSAVRSYVGYSS